MGHGGSQYALTHALAAPSTSSCAISTGGAPTQSAVKTAPSVTPSAAAARGRLQKLPSLRARLQKLARTYKSASPGEREREKRDRATNASLSAAQTRWTQLLCCWPALSASLSHGEVFRRCICIRARRKLTSPLDVCCGCNNAISIALYRRCEKRGCAQVSNAIYV